MAGALDEITAALKKNWLELGLIGAALTSNESKVKSLANAVKEIAIWRLIPITASFAGALMGVRTIIRGIVQDSGALEAAWKRLGRLAMYQGQLEPLLKSVSAARQRLAELMKVANGKWDLSAVVEGSRALSILTRNALGGEESLTRAGVAARSAGVSIDRAANAIGQMYLELQEGAPVAAAAAELQSMGVITQQTTNDLTQMQQTGTSFAVMWDAVEKAIDGSAKSTDNFAQSADGLTKRLDEARETMMAAFGAPFLKSEAAAMENSIAIAQNLTPVMAVLGSTLSTVVNVADNLGNGFTRLVTGIPGVTTAVSVLTKGFVLMTTAISAVGLYQFIRAFSQWGPALLTVAKNLNLVTLAVTLQAKERKALATVEALESVAGAGTATVQRTLAKAYGLGASAAIRAGEAAGGLLGKLRALFVGMLTNPIGIVITLVVLLTTAFWTWYERVQEQEKALRELKEANREVTDAMEKQIEALKTQEDAQQALVESTNQLIEAKKKLAELNADKNATPAMRDEQQDQIARIIEQRNQILKAKASGRLGDDAEHEAIKQQAAERRFNLERTRENNAIEQASGMKKYQEMDAAQSRAQKMVDEGLQYQKDKADYDQFEKETREKMKTAEPTRQGELKYELWKRKRFNNSPILREEQLITDAQQNGASPQKIQEMSDKLREHKKNIVDKFGENQERADDLKKQMVDEARMNAFRQVGLDAATRMAALRSEGMTRAEQEHGERMGTFHEERKLLRGKENGPEMQDLENRIAAEQQSYDLMVKKAEIERAMDEAHLRTLAMEHRMLELTSQGRFGEASALRKQSLATQDLMAFNESVQQKLASGNYTETGAREAAAREQRQREAGRVSQSNAFLAEAGRGFKERALALRGGNSAELLHLKDEDMVRGHLKEGIENGLSGEQLRRYAQTASGLSLSEQAQDITRGSMVTSSLARIGGGGGTYGVDGVKELAKRQADLLQIIADNTKPANNGKGIK